MATVNLKINNIPVTVPADYTGFRALSGPGDVGRGVSAASDRSR